MLWVLLLSWPSAWCVESEAPAGYHLVAEDDCGSEDAASHVVRGTPYLFAAEQVKEPYQHRTIVFDSQYCLLRYLHPKPAASYKVDVVYVTQAGAPRVQRLEANGLPVHDAMDLPYSTPRSYRFDIPQAAVARGKGLDLKFVNVSGANAVVCFVRLWSTDPTPLPAEAQFWTPRGSVERDWVQQDRLRGRPSFLHWDDPAREVRENVLPCINEQLERGRQILADLRLLASQGLDASERELGAVVRARDALAAAKSLDAEAWCALYRDVRWAVRRLAFKNPLLPQNGLLFVRRHHSDVMHQCARRLGAFTRPGGGVCILREIRADGTGEAECITQGKLPNGTFSRPDLSFDGRRIIFGYAPERTEGPPVHTYGQIGSLNYRGAHLFATHKLGYCEPFQVWEMGLDGSSPRQLTQGPYENSDPIHLPDGRILFASERYGGLVQCGDWALSYCLYTMQPDGSDIRKLTRAKEGEWDPSVLADGSILFTRWEYMMKFWSPIQMLWRVRPDGTNPHIAYGSDLSRKYAYPLNYASGRQIPGTSQVACIGSAHHNTGAGPLCVVDLRLGRDIAEGLQRVTPVRFVETPDRQPDAGWYDCPYPLSSKYFLVSYSLARNEGATRSYGIYLLDTYGGRELIYRDRELSAMYPMPIAPRRLPQVADTRDEEAREGGEFLALDVTRGLPESVRGQARYLRVTEAHERHVHTNPYDMQVGPDSGFETKTVLGTVPIERDGSAWFRLPSERSVFFAVLDGNHQALHVMRATTDVRRGERTGCIGCHEPMSEAPAVGRDTPLAMMRGPSDIKPPPWGVRPMSYAQLVQPLLDRQCARCHDGTTGKDKSFDLTARQTKPFMRMPIPQSYYNLRRYVRHAPIHTYFKPPLTFGSRVSPVMQTLAKGHYDVTLTPADWRLLCAWIDCNAPYLDDYTKLAVQQ